MRKVLFCLLATLTLTGCGLYSKYKPVTTVADNLYGDVQLSDSAANLANMTWRELFTDPLLQALMDSALANNVDLQVAHEHVEQAKAELLGARLSYLPSIQLQPTGGWGGAWKNGQGSANWTYNLAVSASWEIDIFGRTWNSLKRAQSARTMTEDYEQACRIGLIAEVAELYYTLLMLDAQKQVAVSTNETWLQTVDIIRQMKEAGMANEAGVSQLQASCYAIQTTVLDLDYQIRQVENAFRLLLNRPGMTIARGQLSEQTMPEMLNVGLPVQILYNRPDVRAAQQVMAQAHYSRQLATANCLPSLSLSGLLGWTNSQSGIMLDPMTMIASVAGSLFVPIFQSGRNIAQVRAAKSQQRESCLQFSKVVVNAGNEVNEALACYQTCQQKAQLFDDQVTSLEKAYEATSLLMHYGSATYLDVLTAQNSLLEAQFTRIANRQEQLKSVVNLYHALGGGKE